MTKPTPSTAELELSSATDNKTRELKDILNKVTSLRNEEVDVIRALVDLSRGLKIE